MSNEHAVVNTSAGTFVIDLRPDLAPNLSGTFAWCTNRVAQPFTGLLAGAAKPATRVERLRSVSSTECV
jgi:hypothetical protein